MMLFLFVCLSVVQSHNFNLCGSGWKRNSKRLGLAPQKWALSFSCFYLYVFFFGGGVGRRRVAFVLFSVFVLFWVCFFCSF